MLREKDVERQRLGAWALDRSVALALLARGAPVDAPRRVKAEHSSRLQSLCTALPGKKHICKLKWKQVSTDFPTQDVVTGWRAG